MIDQILEYIKDSYPWVTIHDDICGGKIIYGRRTNSSSNDIKPQISISKENEIKLCIGSDFEIYKILKEKEFI